MTSNTSAVEVFEYMGNDQRAPYDVVEARIHSSVTEIGHFAFNECKSLKKVVFNEGLQRIGIRVFYRCRQLEFINIPSTLDEIGDSAFLTCRKLKIESLNEGLQEIGKFAFEDCRQIVSMTLPSTLIHIDDDAFKGCVRMRKVVFNRMNHSKLKKIGRSAFEGCTSLQSISLPSSLTEIGENAFWYCQELREVVIHNEEVQIGETAFDDCTSLERLKFPSLSTRLDNIIQAGQRDIEAKMDDISAVEWRGGELSTPLVNQEREDQLGRMRMVFGVDDEKLDKVVRLIEYYELQVATTLFELALWKAKIDQAEEASDINRETHRIEVPGPVKYTILQYLGKSLI